MSLPDQSSWLETQGCNRLRGCSYVSNRFRRVQETHKPNFLSKPNESWVKIVEGKTSLFAPEASLNSDIPPWLPAFYNPRALSNRDISMIIYRGFASRFSRKVTMADSLTGVGARGIRVAVEVPEVSEVYLNDVNKAGIDVAEVSAQINHVSGRCYFSTLDAYNFLAAHSDVGRRFDIVDVDPFGCPTPYTECALRALVSHGLISVTATDTAVLCGVYPKVAYRKYQGFSLRTEYCHEIGIRLVIGSLAFTSMRLSIGIHPIFVHTTGHYVRIYASVSPSVREANKLVDNMGFILHCHRCEYRITAHVPIENCDACGAKYSIAGPLWIGSIYDLSFLKRLEELEDPLIDRYRKLFETARQEIGMPATYFVTDRISRRLRVKSPNMSTLIDALRERGFKATRTAINFKGLRTTAPPSAIIETVKEVVSPLQI